MEVHNVSVNQQELERSYEGWLNFTKFAKYGIIFVIVLLVLMAIFLI